MNPQSNGFQVVAGGDNINNQSGGQRQSTTYAAPMRLREDRPTGIYWPEFWIQERGEGEEGGPFRRPRFILVPKSLMLADHNPNRLRNVLSFTLSTDVFEGEILEISSLAEQEFMMKTAINSPFRLVNPARVFSFLLISEIAVRNARSLGFRWFKFAPGAGGGRGGSPIVRPPPTKMTTIVSVDWNHCRTIEILVLQTCDQPAGNETDELPLSMIPVYIREFS